MQWRHLCLVRAWSAAGLLAGLLVGPSATAEPADPLPDAAAVTETVGVLEARKAGDLAIEARGNGQDRVRIALKNTSSKRLNVVFPPGLVASNALAQAGRAGGGFQSMGLGSVSNRPGGFGRFGGEARETGFRSVAVKPDELQGAVTVPAGQTIDLTVAAVCLNFGMPTPTYRDRFEVVAVNDYTNDPRTRKALRTLSELGTSQGVAQAAMWRVCNDLPFEAMLAQNGPVLNRHEIALAARFVEALDASADVEKLDPSYLTESRILVRMAGDGPLGAESKRLGGALAPLRLMGLPIRLVENDATPETPAPALLLDVKLTANPAGETQGRVVLSYARRGEGWITLGKTTFKANSNATVLEGQELAGAIDCAVANALVRVKVARRGTTATTLKVENGLPFTLATVMIQPAGSSGVPALAFRGVGIGPARSAMLPIQAAGGTIDRIELNGL